MKLTYLYHDCFLLEFEKCYVITDYFSGVKINPTSLLNNNKPCYVLVSHHHKDHFSPEIFSWASFLPNVIYIISSDVASLSRHFFNKDSIYKGHNKVDEKKVTVLRPGDTFKDSNISVTAFGSTDIGNSYVIEAEGKRIFFAGDLNAWTWREESSPEEVNEMLNGFQAILRNIKSHFKNFNIAMFPVDPRMGNDMLEGALIFCNEFKVDHFIPMHFELWDTSEKREDFVNIVLKEGNKFLKTITSEYVPLLTPGQSFYISNK